jgi:hypothetical protein
MRITIKGQEVNISEDLADLFSKMEKINTRGGFARVSNYRNRRGRVASFTFNSNFSLTNNYHARVKELKSLAFSDVRMNLDYLTKFFTEGSIAKFTNSTLDTLNKVFNARISKMVESMTKTINDEQDSPIADGHARNSISFSWGRVYFENAKGVDGKLHPILDSDGIPTVYSIKINALVDYNNNYVVHEEGEKKVTNSGIPVIMEKLIEKAIKTRHFQNLTVNNNDTQTIRVDGIEV